MPSLVVVGAGVLGASVAHCAAGQGWDVTLVDRAAGGDPRAASGGESRLLRSGHGADLSYTLLARRAWTLWADLERESGRSLVARSGLVWLAEQEDGWEADTERTLRAQDIPAARVDPAAALPGLDPVGLAFALLESEAGAILARRATLTLGEQARVRGARLVVGTAQPRGDTVVVRDPTGVPTTLTADHVVWAVGGWLPTLFPDVPIRVTRQDLHFFRPPGQGWGLTERPCWIDYAGPFYGTGVGPAGEGPPGVKVGDDTNGSTTHPDALRGPAPAASTHKVRTYLRRRFPSLADADLVGTVSCQYALTPDTHFLAAPLPEHPSVWLLGGDSGHGFKHAPALAERLVPMLSGAEPADPRWALGPRQAGPGLRTAGVAPPTATLSSR